MADRLRVGIAGYGVVGRRRHGFIDSNPHLKVVALSDVRLDHEDTENDVRRYRDYHRMIAENNLDVLFVCLPNDVAPEATILGLKAGLHVFCEKPPGRTVGDIRAVREVEAANPKLKLKYGFNHRYHDSVREALNIVQSGHFGRVLNMRGVYGKSAVVPWPREANGYYWRCERAVAGGGILLDQGIHMVDLMRCFAGEFTELKSFVSNDFWKLDVEDNAYALMRSERGVIAMLHSTATQWRHKFALEIALEKGALLLEGILSGTKSYGKETLTVVFADEKAGGSPRETTSTYVDDNSWRDEVEEFANAIVNDIPIEIGTSMDALKTMELVYSIYLADPDWRENWKISMD